MLLNIWHVVSTQNQGSCWLKFFFNFYYDDDFHSLPSQVPRLSPGLSSRCLTHLLHSPARPAPGASPLLTSSRKPWAPPPMQPCSSTHRGCTHPDTSWEARVLCPAVIRSWAVPKLCPLSHPRPALPRCASWLPDGIAPENTKCHPLRQRFSTGGAFVPPPQEALVVTNGMHREEGCYCRLVSGSQGGC